MCVGGGGIIPYWKETLCSLHIAYGTYLDLAVCIDGSDTIPLLLSHWIREQVLMRDGHLPKPRVTPKTRFTHVEWQTLEISRNTEIILLSKEWTAIGRRERKWAMQYSTHHVQLSYVEMRLTWECSLLNEAYPPYAMHDWELCKQPLQRLRSRGSIVPMPEHHLTELIP